MIYVDATAAFLPRDPAPLLLVRQRIVSQLPKDPNPPVMDSFIAHFGES